MKVQRSESSLQLFTVNVGPRAVLQLCASVKFHVVDDQTDSAWTGVHLIALNARKERKVLNRWIHRKIYILMERYIDR